MTVRWIFASLLVAVAFALATQNAYADSISLSLDPTETTGDRPVGYTVIGELSPPGAWVSIVWLAQGECAASRPENPFAWRNTVAGHAVESLPSSGGFFAPFERGRYAVCAYLQKATFPNPLDWEYAEVLARAETTLTVSMSLREAEEAEERRAREEAEARAREEAEARARKASEENVRRATEKAVAEAAKEAASEQKHRAEAAEEAALEHEYLAYVYREEHKPLQQLTVRTVSHPGRSSQRPGHTSIEITAAPFAQVTIRLTRFGHLTWHLHWGEEATALAMQMPWRCSSPGDTYRYVITAQTRVGPTLTRRGSFKPVSSSRCRALKRREQEARERSNREYAEGVRRERQAEEETLRHWEHNCREERGTPKTIETGEGPIRVCVAPGGGLIPVLA